MRPWASTTAAKHANIRVFTQHFHREAIDCADGASKAETDEGAGKTGLHRANAFMKARGMGELSASNRIMCGSRRFPQKSETETTSSRNPVARP